MYIYDNVTFVVGRMTIFVETINKHTICYINYFRKSYRYEIKRKNTVEAGMQATDNNIIRRRKDAIYMQHN